MIRCLATLCVSLLLCLSLGGEAVAATAFEKLAGLWIGEGRLGMRGGETEAVKCRVTYRTEEHGTALKQSIRCASQGGSVEVKVAAHLDGTAVTGSWEETTRGWSGELAGNTTATGLQVRVRSETVSANMDILVREPRQIVEIQFLEGPLQGLSLVLTKQRED